MKIAFLADPLSTFKIYKDSTFAMMREAAARGHHIYAFQQQDMALESGIVTAQAQRVHLTGDATNWYRTDAAAVAFLSEFDAIVVRKDPPFDMEYIYTTYLLEVAEKQGARVFNKPAAIRDHNEKLAITQFPQYIAPTLVSRDEKRLRAFHAEHGDVIFKPLDGMGGTGIFRVGKDALNLGAIIEGLTQNGRSTIMVQRYIPAIKEGDKRILLIGGKVVPQVLARIPQGTEVRGNLAAGGKGVAQAISASNLAMAEALAPVLYERGLLLVGLDAIGDHLTEINVTSPTCFQEIAEQTGFDVAAMFIDALEHAGRG
jgi:glutathione synthase